MNIIQFEWFLQQPGTSIIERRWDMKRAIMAVLCLVMLHSVAFAATWRVDATVDPAYASIGHSDFWITFDDADNDGQVGLGDMTGFSGVTFPVAGSSTGSEPFHYEVLKLPALDIIFGGAVVLTLLKNDLDNWNFPMFDENWVFYNGNIYGYGNGMESEYWTYGATATPIPGAVWLLGSGLLGLVGLRRKMKA
jgi:hypothetical protein